MFHQLERRIHVQHVCLCLSASGFIVAPTFLSTLLKAAACGDANDTDDDDDRICMQLCFILRRQCKNHVKHFSLEENQSQHIHTKLMSQFCKFNFVSLGLGSGWNSFNRIVSITIPCNFFSLCSFVIRSSLSSHFYSFFLHSFFHSRWVR